jgi:alkaline phosphatase D
VTQPAAASAAHTVRLVPTELEAGRVYYYRFEVGATTTPVGRTKTAPAEGADVPVKFAFCACQDYIGRYYHAWKALLDEKADLDFVLFLGDYIYESVNDARFQSTTPDRAIKLPDGIDTSKAQDQSRIAASTVADYRTLYKTYRKDALLREVHRLYPFVITWDDHEFADDCWQDHSTSFDGQDPVTKGPLAGDEKNTPRRTAANRAFFDYQPLDVTYKANLAFPFDIQIYRKIRYGKHVELFLTDQRSYRADHLIPEGKADLAVGKFTNYTMIGSRYFVRKPGFDPKEASAKPSLLGATQKAWFLDAVKKSDATWKVWGNEVQVYQMALDLTKLPGVPDSIFGIKPYTVYVNADQWDGFRSERAEILGALTDANVENLLVCTGDIHSFYAAELHVDFDAPKPKPVGVEYVTAGISSASLKGLMEKLIPAGNPLRFVVDAWTGGADKALTESNPHLRYTDTDSYGFALMTIDATKAEATFVHVGDPLKPTSEGVLERTKFVTAVGTNKVTPA